jgi:cell pole-organizing protein PopZ
MSQASPSKEPSMDEILASIRRIIESGDGQASSVLPGSVDRDPSAANGETAANIAPVGVPSAFTPSSPASRVVPLSERLGASRTTESPEARWLPIVEPANKPAEDAPDVEASEARSGIEDPALEAVGSSSLQDPAEARDRWTRELDDVETWPVLDGKDASADPQLNVDARTTPRHAAGDDATGSNPVLVEAAPIAASSSDGDDVDFPLDFDEADFVEALDRNTSFADLGRDVRDTVPSNDARSSPGTTASDIFTASSRPLRDTPLFSAVPSASVMQETSALMSRQAGAQVAAAFDDLARAIRDGQMKSMEDMAREMLRPMLQDWLDDNLPRLVERLVREEIERVSRGGRR